MAFLVEQGQDAVHSTSYQAARDALTAKLKVDNAKQLARARLERAINKGGKGRGPSYGPATSK